jgi:uncharacterized membrane protein YbaN (DUF454 family)
MNQIKRLLFIIAGFIALALAGVGVIATFIPFFPFPTTPFLLLASFCFSRGSEQFNNWFKNTKIYEKYLADFVQTRSMTLKQKSAILALASLGLMIPFILIDTLLMRSFLILMFICKYAYFIFAIKTIKESSFYGSEKKSVLE